MRLFLRHLYTRGRLQRPCAKEAASGPDSYLRPYKDYVRKNRGLTENSVHVYAPFICDFSGQTMPAGSLSPDALETLKIQSFLLAQTQGPVGRK